MSRNKTKISIYFLKKCMVFTKMAKIFIDTVKILYKCVDFFMFVEYNTSERW